MVGLRELVAEVGVASFREAARVRNASSMRGLVLAHNASQEIARFHAENLGVLTVGSALGPTRQLEDGAHEQRYSFGSIIKPLDAAPKIPVRFVVTIDIAAIKCFGTEDPSGEDETYLIATIYAVDPMARERAVQTKRIDFGEIEEGLVFGQGHQLVEGFFIPGDGSIRLHVGLFDVESGGQKELEKKWGDTAKAGIIGGLAAINPALGAGAIAVEEATGLIGDVSKVLGGAVAEIFGDDTIAVRDLDIKADFLQRLIAEGSNGLPRTSGSIPGIGYNFPELAEGGDEGRQWLFEGGGGSYRIFFSVRAGPLTLSPSPTP
jgi:hypothetical protein